VSIGYTGRFRFVQLSEERPPSHSELIALKCRVSIYQCLKDVYLKQKKHLIDEVFLDGFLFDQSTDRRRLTVSV
jgi:hypothetical protein